MAQQPAGRHLRRLIQPNSQIMYQLIKNTHSYIVYILNDGNIYPQLCQHCHSEKEALALADQYFPDGYDHIYHIEQL